MALLASKPCSLANPVPRTASRQRVSVQCAAWTKATNKSEIQANGGRKVCEIGGQRVLVAEADGQIYAVSNKCSHLGLPLVGKTALLQGKVQDKCIVCPAHGTAFDLASGEVKGKWCPSLPDGISTGFGLTPPKPLPTFQSRVTESGDVEVMI
mmetsp:Transcript_25739/g.69873  ORF Transcript_25739/g.69873 Transcript_25739/m.69873 type:complete len:153 (+) Transcript_25739:88-546(+)|eukprot:CAMPEP_0202412610 /NCGR_PEP_ID=MMETSP1128-20130828/26298_1 /ASSEMBLY_ACC=CAM_ASM_000463 /TAXON_ID=3047 /ORGANISM="Dunaliella tertiolecta, Strain CCMP1320" /LENGTH=152 /DNA_ID=CAMNT_0049018559 /DNA_START=40 /DNA_END=498 /DNA_ORIENTATION=+